ncbi:MAG: phosphopyruvate hydratase [Pirellulales bacterium]|nr:phosphopyruvate hydratase [Pirellulales bacterium]
MTVIAKVHAREVLDSRGRPTVEVEMLDDAGHCASAMVPSGASTGRFEALELRDGDLARYDGAGVLRAVDNVNRVIGPALMGLDPADQFSIDDRLLALDPTDRKTQLGGNALLGASLAALRLGAAARHVWLYEHIFATYEPTTAAGSERAAAQTIDRPRMPLPMINMISGGLHAGGNLDFQDVLVQPVGAPDLATGLEWTVRIYRRLGKLLAEAGYEGTLVGDEGGFGPRLKSNREAIEFVVRAIAAAGLRPGLDVTLALDVAATHFYSDGMYRLRATSGGALTSDELVDEIERLISEYPITSVEDALAEEDWSGWQMLTARLGNKVQLVGDDLFTTNPARIRWGIETGAANAVLVKVNQIGTVSESLRALRLAHSAGYRRIVSARSGETEDSTLADLAVGVGAEQIKIGSIARSERLAKYNRLLKIAERLEGVKTA